jgi:hypothetical protein
MATARGLSVINQKQGSRAIGCAASASAGDGPDYAVHVNVERLTPQIAKKIPKRVLDVDVIVAEVGDVQPHRGVARKYPHANITAS